MMVNSISGVRFCGAADDILARPGKYSAPNQQPAAPAQEKAGKSSSKTKKVVIGTVATLAVLAALVALPKKWPDTFNVLSEEAMKNAKFTEKVCHYTAKAGKFIGKYTYEPLVKCWNSLFSKADKAADVVA